MFNHGQLASAQPKITIKQRATVHDCMKPNQVLSLTIVDLQQRSKAHSYSARWVGEWYIDPWMCLGTIMVTRLTIILKNEIEIYKIYTKSNNISLLSAISFNKNIGFDGF